VISCPVIAGPGAASAASVRTTASLIVGLVVIGPTATRQGTQLVRLDHVIRTASRPRLTARGPVAPAAAEAPASPLERRAPLLRSGTGGTAVLPAAQARPAATRAASPALLVAVLLDLVPLTTIPPVGGFAA
jgi:hypothetical protein